MIVSCDDDSSYLLDSREEEEEEDGDGSLLSLLSQHHVHHALCGEGDHRGDGGGSHLKSAMTLGGLAA